MRTGLLTWACINFSFIRFYYGCKRQGIDRNEFPFKAPFVRRFSPSRNFSQSEANAVASLQQPWFSMFGLFMIIMVIIFNGKSSVRGRSSPGQASLEDASVPRRSNKARVEQNRGY